MLGLVVAVDQPASEKVIPGRSYLTDIAGDPGSGVSHGRHCQFRHSLHALKGNGRCKADLISIERLGGHVRIVHRHSEKSSLRKDILGLSPFDQRLESGKYP